MIDGLAFLSGYCVFLSPLVGSRWVFVCEALVLVSFVNTQRGLV